MKIFDLGLDGLKKIVPDVIRDARGFFVESYHESRYRARGILPRFVQDNHSRSVLGTLRGLHYQSKPGQDKLVRVTTGRIWDVAVDIRPQSKTFGKWEAIILDADKHEQLFVPIGFAHGFAVLSETADVEYKVSAPYDSSTECTIRYDDPELEIAWPTALPILSPRDQEGGSFADLRRNFSRSVP